MKKEHAADKVGLVVKTVVSHFIVWIARSSVDQWCFDLGTTSTTAQQLSGLGVNLFKSSVILFIVVWPGHMPICWYNKKSNEHAIFRAIYDIRTSNKQPQQAMREPKTKPKLAKRRENKRKERDCVNFSLISAGVVLHFIVWTHATVYDWSFQAQSLSHSRSAAVDRTSFYLVILTESIHSNRGKLMTAFILLFTLIQMGNKQKIMIKRLWLNELTVLAGNVNVLTHRSMMNLHEIKHRVDRSVFYDGILFLFFHYKIHGLQLCSDRWYQILWFLSIYMSEFLSFFCIKNEYFYCLILEDESSTFNNILRIGKFNAWIEHRAAMDERETGEIKQLKHQIENILLQTVNLSQI